MAYALTVEGISKSYRIGGTHPVSTFREALTAMPSAVPRFLRRTLRPGVPPQEDTTFWALRDICFDLPQGRALGILGRNGAGKSTLLKILSKITHPTRGTAKVRGRVGALLEVGTGFHPELTGRQNIYLNGAILGMTHADIRTRFDEIVAFSEVERFLDTPVKFYSSGMHMRLAFAVAAHLEPEVMVVDEVLAVGDATFQRKCIGRMKEVAGQGRTVLFVSHNTSAVRAFCQDGLLLRDGEIAAVGGIEDVLAQYLRQSDSGKTTHWVGNEGDESVRLLETSIMSSDGGPMHTAVDLQVVITAEVKKSIEGLILGFRLFSEFDTELAYCLYDDPEQSPAPVVRPGILRARFVIPKNTLGTGNYRIGIALGIHCLKSIIHHSAGTLIFDLPNVSGIGLRFPVPHIRGFASLLRPDWAGDV